MKTKLLILLLSAIMFFGVGLENALYNHNFGLFMTAVIWIVSFFVCIKAWNLKNILDLNDCKDKFIFKVILVHILIMLIMNLSNLFYSLQYNLSGLVASVNLGLILILHKEINYYTNQNIRNIHENNK